nr:hypothetical protein [Clostridia bacterium]
MDASKIKGFVLTHKVKGRETTTRFDVKEFALFKEWVEICQKNGYEFEASVIEKDDSTKPIQF